MSVTYEFIITINNIKLEERLFPEYAIIAIIAILLLMGYSHHWMARCIYIHYLLAEIIKILVYFESNSLCNTSDKLKVNIALVFSTIQTIHSCRPHQ